MAHPRRGNTAKALLKYGPAWGAQRFHRHLGPLTCTGHHTFGVKPPRFCFREPCASITAAERQEFTPISCRTGCVFGRPMRGCCCRLRQATSMPGVHHAAVPSSSSHPRPGQWSLGSSPAEPRWRGQAPHRSLAPQLHTYL